MTTIRPERTFEQYSRGAQLIQAILEMWVLNDRIEPGTEGRTQTINGRISSIMAEYDLTIDEWHYWAKQARQVEPR